MNLPLNHKKIARYRDLSIDQILATKPKKVLKKYTVNKHLGRANMLCDWLLRHGYVQVNYFKGMNLRSNERRADEERDVFDGDDLKKIYQ